MAAVPLVRWRFRGAGRRNSRGRSRTVLSCRSGARVWLQSSTRLKPNFMRTLRILLALGLLLIASACSPRDFLTRRLASDLIASSETFKSTQQFFLRTGLISNKDYVSPEYLVLQRRGWVTGSVAPCPPEVAPAPCWQVALTPIGVETFHDLIPSGAVDSQ